MEVHQFNSQVGKYRFHYQVALHSQPCPWRHRHLSPSTAKVPNQRSPRSMPRHLLSLIWSKVLQTSAFLLLLPSSYGQVRLCKPPCMQSVPHPLTCCHSCLQSLRCCFCLFSYTLCQNVSGPQALPFLVLDSCYFSLWELRWCPVGKPRWCRIAATPVS